MRHYVSLRHFQGLSCIAAPSVLYYAKLMNNAKPLPRVSMLGKLSGATYKYEHSPTHMTMYSKPYAFAFCIKAMVE